MKASVRLGLLLSGSAIAAVTAWNAAGAQEPAAPPPGAEWKFAAGWSARAEYLYVDFGSHSNTISYDYAGNDSTLTSSDRERDNIVRFGVNYMFGH
jgi:hypothetical protein